MMNSFTQPPRRATRGSRATKMLCAVATCVTPSPGFATVNAPKLEAARPFESHLRRSIAIEGEEQGQFHLADRMVHYRVPAVSVAVIDGCRIVDARAFGRSASGASVTPRTLFQAGSISKSITAVAVLKLVEQKKLSLDHDIQPLLTSWTLKGSSLKATEPVTLRRLLNHTAGVNEIGGFGYAPGTPIPTVTQILDGLPPTNTPAVRIESTPGSRWLYSSGGYYVVQALMTDVSGEAFPRIVDRLVLGPAGMNDSIFAQPLDTKRARLAAAAVGPDGSAMPGGWRVNPELAAGGLWSTPSDLARFAIALARSARGENGGLLGLDATRQMMTPGLKNWGLGVELGPAPGPRRFGHTGHNTGFVSEFVMYPDSCQGAAVMTNADEGGWLVTEVLRAVGDVYGWPGRRPSPVQAAVPLTEAIAARFVGTFRLRDFPGEGFTVSRMPDRKLYWARIGHVGRELLPESETRLFSPDSRMSLEVVDKEARRAETLELGFGGGKNVAERVE